MKMIDLLEKDKDRLITDLTAAGVPDRAITVMNNEVDKLLIKYNEQCESEKERDAAAYMMQAVRLSVPMIDSAGETKIWESEAEKNGKGKISLVGVILLVAAIVLLIIGIVPLVDELTRVIGIDAVTLRFGLIAGGAILMLVSGIFFGRPGKQKQGTKERHVEIRIDAQKVYRSFRTAILAVDQSLEEVQAAERWSKREKAGSIDGRTATTPEIDMFSDLLAASYSRDPEYALEKIDDVKYFLHKQQIEVVDYSEETKKYFDLMPGTEAGTIRPALVSDGVLLKKGLASNGR